MGREEAGGWKERLGVGEKGVGRREGRGREGAGGKGGEGGKGKGKGR